MKKILFALALVATLGMVGCSKDEDTDQKNEEKTTIDWGIVSQLYGKEKSVAQTILTNAGYDSIDIKYSDLYYYNHVNKDTVYIGFEGTMVTYACQRYYEKGDATKSVFAKRFNNGLDSVYTYENKTYNFTSCNIYFISTGNYNSTNYKEFKDIINGKDDLRSTYGQWVNENLMIYISTFRYGQDAQSYNTRIEITFIDPKR